MDDKAQKFKEKTERARLYSLARTKTIAIMQKKYTDEWAIELAKQCELLGIKPTNRNARLGQLVNRIKELEEELKKVKGL
jgi:hypothetical protein